MNKGTFKHYRIQPDGSLKFVGEVAYRHTVEATPDFDTLLRESLGYDATTADEAFAATRDAAETFEALVDQVGETED